MDKFNAYLEELKKHKSSVPQEKNSPRIKKQFIGLAAFAMIALSLPITIFMINQQQDVRQRAAGDSQIEFGFNTHISAVNNNLDLNKFKSNVDVLVQNNQKMIRFNIIDFEVAQPVNASSSSRIVWNQTNLATYDQAIDYALSKKLKIFLVTNTPSFAKDYSLADYKTITKEYYSFLSQRYADKITIWQVFNEADVHHYADYRTITTFPEDYLPSLNSIIAEARNLIRGNNSSTLVTTNVGGYPMNDELINNWYKFFDAVKDNIDILAVDMYPAPNMNEITKLNQRISGLENRYGKKVVVAETGVCTATNVFTVADQQNYVTEIMKNLKFSTATYVLLYEIMDENTSSNLCEDTFGIMTTNGDKKSSFNAIMASMQPQTIPTQSQPSPTTPYKPPTSAPTSTRLSPTPTGRLNSTPTPFKTPTPIPTATKVPTPTLSLICTAPKILSYSDTNKSGGGIVSFSWNSVPGATRYTIQRQAGSSWQTFTTTSINKFIGSDGNSDPNWRVFVSSGNCKPIPGPFTYLDP